MITRITDFHERPGGVLFSCHHKPPLQIPNSIPDSHIQLTPTTVLGNEREVEEKLNDIIDDDFWIIDGWGSWATIEKRFNAADTIIFVDHSLGIHIWWALKRQIAALFFPENLDKPEGCNLLDITGRMFKMIWTIHRKLRPRLLDLVNTYKGSRRVYHIKSPAELRRFMLQHC